MRIQWYRIPGQWETLRPLPVSAGESPARGVGQGTRAFHLVTSGSDFRLAQNSLPPTFRLLFSLHSTSTRICNKAPLRQPPENPTRQGCCECVQTFAQDLEVAMGCYLTEEQRRVFRTEWLIPPPAIHLPLTLLPVSCPGPFRSLDSTASHSAGASPSPLFLSPANTPNPPNSHSFLMLKSLWLCVSHSQVAPALLSFYSHSGPSISLLF